jgi:hypothetical protein
VYFSLLLVHALCTWEFFSRFNKDLITYQKKEEELSGRPPHQRKREGRERGGGGGSGIPFGMSHNKHPLFKSGSIYYEMCDRTLTLKKD